MDKIGGRYPESYGWESWLLFKALQMGYEILNLTELRFRHIRPYSSKQTFNWGKAMWTLGYHPLFVIARFIKNVIFRDEPLGFYPNLKMLMGYLTGPLQTDSYSTRFDSDLRSFIRQSQVSRLTRLSYRLVHRS
jgi:hypothetical protein